MRFLVHLEYACVSVIKKVEERRMILLPDAALRPDRRYSTADRQTVHGLPPVANFLFATLRA